MTPKIIKQGTARASIVQGFTFSEQCSGGTALIERPFPENAPPIPVIPMDGTGRDAALPAQATDPVQVEKEAYEKGLRLGEKAGMEMAERKLEAIMRRYSDALLEVGTLRSNLHAQVEREIVRLAIAVARKIIHREIQVDRDIIQTLVRVALSHVSDKSAVTIHLNPVDYGYLLERRAELSQSEGRNISLLSDKSIERGGCLIQTDCGDVDARIDEEFREVENAFFKDQK